MATGVLKRAWDKINNLWVPWNVTDGAAHVGIFNSSGTQIDSFGTDVFPESWSLDFSFSGTVAALGTTAVISSYSKGSFVISGLATETISVTGLIGAAMTIETAAIRVIDLNTGAVAAASALGNGSYKIVDMAVHKLKFTKSAAVDNATVTGTLKA